MSGRPLQIIRNVHNFMEVDEDLLMRTLLTTEIEDRFVCVISIAGAFRKGKSFMLNFFLRYMYMKYVHNDVADFLGGENDPLSGFSWRHGTERETTGILMWSDVFLHDYENGDKVAIILLDTQGSFDHQSTVRDCASIFALSTMISSVQIYNISQQIQENDLQHLELFVNYGKIATESSSSKPFQQLIFLVRDWSYGKEYPFGAVGGNKYLENVLKVKSTQQKQLQETRKNINDCFMELACFVMPHPGLEVDSDSTFNGCLKDIGGDFKKKLLELAPLLLSPENLVIKEVAGVKVSAKEWINYIQNYVKNFKDGNLPEPKTLLIATSEIYNQSSVAESRIMYNTLMKTKCSDDKIALSEENLLSYHREFQQKAISNFDDKPKLGHYELIKSYRDRLQTDIDEDFEIFTVVNKGKSFRLEIELLDKINQLTTNYSKLLNEKIGDDKAFVDREDLKNFHLENLYKITSSFNSSIECDEKFSEQLKSNLNAAYLNAVNLNEAKESRMEMNRLKWLELAQEFYVKNMEDICKNYVQNIKEAHFEIKQQTLLQFDELFENLSKTDAKCCREKLHTFFDERFSYFALINKTNYDHLESAIVNVALSLRLKFVKSFTEKCHLETNDLNLNSTEIQRAILDEFDLQCKHINYDIWKVCRTNLAYDLDIASNYIISVLNQSKRENSVNKLIALADFFGTVALGGGSKLAECGKLVLRASQMAKAALQFNNNPNF